MKLIAVIDYGMGNLHSVAKAVEHVAEHARVEITRDADTILEADRVILPGVGAIRDCMGELCRLGLNQTVYKAIEQGQPLLGICVGMQILLSHSEENGGIDCLNQLHGKVKRFDEHMKNSQGQQLKVPHMGWNQVQQIQREDEVHPLWHNIEDQSRFYFVHSYYAEMENPADVIGRCDYGIGFDAVLARKNLAAVQFHPEKSHDAGLQLFKNFLQWDGQA